MLDALTLDQMRAFVTVAEAGSFRAGAQQLQRVQSAVSHAIGNLEDQLGVALFDRSTHRPTLTREGRALLADARAILLKVDFMRARARGLGEGVELSLSIALDPQFPMEFLTVALKDLRAAYPSIVVRIIVAPMGDPIAALIDGRCDLAIAAIDLDDPRIALEPLTPAEPLRFLSVAAPDHPLGARPADAPPLNAQDLADHLQIVVEDPSTLTEGRDFAVLSTNVWRVGDMHTKRALILAGIGWGGLPHWMIETDLAAGRLARVPAAAFGRNGEMIQHPYVARRVDAAFGPAARLLQTSLARHVATRDALLAQHQSP